MIAHLILHWLGLDNEAGRPYAFWSGAGSDLGYLAIIGGMWRKHNCHSKGCWRVGRHHVDGTPWCDRHHEQARRGDG